MDTITPIKEHPILFSTPMVLAILEGRKTQTRRIIKNPAFKNAIGFRINSTIGGKHRWPEAIDEEERGLSGEYNMKCPYGKPGDALWVRETFELCPHDRFYYKADNTFPSPIERWRPSIHMPKSAARIWLQVENIRVERLQEISEEDVKAEGVMLVSPAQLTAREIFMGLWMSINGRESWDANPWVWVVEYKVLSTTGKPLLSEIIK